MFRSSLRLPVLLYAAACFQHKPLCAVCSLVSNAVRCVGGGMLNARFGILLRLFVLRLSRLCNGLRLLPCR